VLASWLLHDTNTVLNTDLLSLAYLVGIRWVTVRLDRRGLRHIQMVWYVIYVGLEPIRCFLLCQLVGVTSIVLMV